MLFAHLKRILKLDRLRLRGPNGAHDEFLRALITVCVAGSENSRQLCSATWSVERASSHVGDGEMIGQNADMGFRYKLTQMYGPAVRSKRTTTNWR